jgi:hypothetical protein
MGQRMDCEVCKQKADRRIQITASRHFNTTDHKLAENIGKLLGISIRFITTARNPISLEHENLRQKHISYYCHKHQPILIPTKYKDLTIVIDDNPYIK